ncbi:MAG: DNA translocase FtsK [Saccharofermentans sp.]|nr:DNA translocase FtsK [Saccharofermentans sp.]
MNKSESKREVTGVILFFCAIALTLMYFLPTDVTGVLGSFIHTFTGGLIGFAAFTLPIFLFYASIDFFLEKREGVSPIRIRSVIIFLVCLSAMLAVITTDFDYLRNLSFDEIDSKYKATKAIALLWKSGSDSSILAPAPDKTVLSGGLLGGLLATSIYTICGKVVSVIALIGVIASQIIMVFHISLKKTMETTAKVVKNTAKAASNTVKRTVQNYQQPRQQVQIPQNAYPQSMYPSRQTATNPFVNTPVKTGPSPIFDDSSNVHDPFNQSLPVDHKTGFVDMTDPAYGVNGTADSGSLTYVNNKVATSSNIGDSDVDFEFGANARNAKPRNHINKTNEPEFLRQKGQADFYDLNGGVYANGEEIDNDYSQDLTSRPIAGGYYSPEDDMPYEVEEEREDDPYIYTSFIPERRIREPHINVVNTNPPPVPQPVAKSPLIKEIGINQSSDDTEGYTRAEGRVIDTSAARNVSVGPDVPSTTQAREGRVIKANNFRNYRPAPTSLLAQDTNKSAKTKSDEEKLRFKATQLEETLRTFGITDAKVVNITHGPAITRFEVTIGIGVKVSKVKSLEDDIALAMAATAVRIEAPIPGKAAIGVEIPNDKTSAVYLRELLDSKEFKAEKDKPLTVALAKDIPGKPILCDLSKMPHLLVAGSTGSGKSVCVNSMLISIMCNASPMDVKLILVDPKVVELSVYNGIPHLLMPVVTDMKIATGALKWAVVEMERRYKLFAEYGVRDIKGCNESLVMEGKEKLPLILIIIDELADLMAVAAKEVEVQIARLAAMARAAGMHMIIATQRPSVDVITGVIKSNIPSRIAFAVSSGVDSRTIIDSYGAEKLLGKGDMLYNPLSAPKAIRGQGAFVSDGEVEAVVKYLKDKYGPMYDKDIEDTVEKISRGEGTGKVDSGSDSGNSESSGDDLLSAAVETVIQAKNASVSILQRRLGVGYPRAARLIDVMEKKGYIGPFEGSKPRKVLITETDWLEIKNKGGVTEE